MPSKKDCVEDVLAQIENEFYRVTAAREDFENFLGGRARISYSTRNPKLKIDIKEAQKPGPKIGSKFCINPGLKAARRLAKQGQDGEEF